MSLPFKLMKAVLIWGQSGDDAMIREIVQKTQCQTIPQNSTIVLFQLKKKQRMRGAAGATPACRKNGLH
jgi:hypothetical protein